MKKMIMFSLVMVMVIISCDKAIAYDEDKWSAGKYLVIGKMGYFMPADKSVKDVYGSGIGFSIGGGYVTDIDISIGGVLDYWKKSYTKNSVTYGLEIMSISSNILAILPGHNKKGFVPYIGAGIGGYSAKMETGSMIEKESSDLALGFHILGGFDYSVLPKLSLNAEAKYASAKTLDMKVGGLTIGGGLLYSF